MFEAWSKPGGKKLRVSKDTAPPTLGTNSGLVGLGPWVIGGQQQRGADGILRGTSARGGLNYSVRYFISGMM